MKFEGDLQRDGANKNLGKFYFWTKQTINNEDVILQLKTHSAIADYKLLPVFAFRTTYIRTYKTTLSVSKVSSVRR